MSRIRFEKKSAVEAFLREKGFTVPHTIVQRTFNGRKSFHVRLSVSGGYECSLMLASDEPVSFSPLRSGNSATPLLSIL